MWCEFFVVVCFCLSVFFDEFNLFVCWALSGSIKCLCSVEVVSIYQGENRTKTWSHYR